MRRCWVVCFVVGLLTTLSFAEIDPDASPANIRYHGFWYTYLKVPRAWKFIHTSGGFDAIDDVADVSNYYVFWSDFQEYPEHSNDEYRVDEGYGFDSMAQRFINMKKQFIVTPNFGGHYPNSQNAAADIPATQVIMPEAWLNMSDGSRRLQPWTWMESQFINIGGQVYSYADLQRRRFKMLWTGWNGGKWRS